MSMAPASAKPGQVAELLSLLEERRLRLRVFGHSTQEIPYVEHNLQIDLVALELEVEARGVQALGPQASTELVAI